MLLGSSTVVMHTIATAYHLRMSRNPSVERSMQYAMGIIRRSGKLLSPKKGSKKRDKTILSEGKGRRQNAKTLVAYVKHKLGLSEKFDYDAFVKRTRLLGDLLYARKIEHFCQGKTPNEVDFDPQNRKKVAWVSEGKPTTTIEPQNVAPSPGISTSLVSNSSEINKARETPSVISPTPPEIKMKLRTVVLHSIPRMTETGCRPYLMVTDSKNNLVYTSMVNGVRNATCFDGVISFHPNVEVESEFQIRVYHLPNGRPGVRCFDTKIRTSSSACLRYETNGPQDKKSKNKVQNDTKGLIDCSSEDDSSSSEMDEYVFTIDEDTRIDLLKEKDAGKTGSVMDAISSYDGDRIITLKQRDLNIFDQDNPCIDENFRLSVVMANIMREGDTRESVGLSSDDRSNGNIKATGNDTSPKPKRDVSNAIEAAIKNALDFRNFSCSPYLKCMNIECGHMIRIESNPSDRDSGDGLNSGYDKAKQIVVCGHCNKGTFLPNIAEPTRMACERRFFCNQGAAKSFFQG